MPDKDNIDDLYLENLDDDLADFLNEADSESVKVEEPEKKIAVTPSSASDSPSPAPENTNAKATTGEETQTSNDTQDWIENEKIDLPGQLALDIYETKEELVVVCRVAGVEDNNIDVSISADNILNIRGSLIARVDENVENHFIQECYWGEFSRSVSLPVDVKKDNIDATLENGILKIIFTKIKQDAIKKIDIKTSGR